MNLPPPALRLPQHLLDHATLLADRLSGVDWDGIDGSWLTLAYDQPH